MTGNFTKNEQLALREMGSTTTPFRWRPKSCASLAEKGLATKRVHSNSRGSYIGYVLTDAGRAALSAIRGED